MYMRISLKATRYESSGSDLTGGYAVWGLGLRVEGLRLRV